MPTQRYKVTLAYRGTNYYGWQRQSVTKYYKGPTPKKGHGIATVQEILARAIETVVLHPVKVVGSSRTDARVHAKGQVAHFDTDQAQIPCIGMCRAINNELPADITIRSIEPVSQDFNAIMSTTCKRYQYAIWNALERPTFFPDLAWYCWKDLDRIAMRQAAKRFVGEHDFASFCRPGHKRIHTVRTVNDCDVSFRGPLVVIGVEGSGFLWNMVRIMVGTLVDVGLGRCSPKDIDTMLTAKDRRAAGLTAPPEGLYLQWVKTTE